MEKILGTILQFTLIIGVATILYGFFKKTNYNEWFGIALCVCTTHWVFDTIKKIIKEVENDS